MQNSHEVHILKANGEREHFAPEKLYTSLVRSGAPADVAEYITGRVASALKDGDRTRDIYARAFSMLRSRERPSAARYSVKRALLDLGPSGYPFEDFLAEIYRALGYSCMTRVMAQGACVEHELDLIATRGSERIGAEVKFHNSAGIKSDVKVTLYVQARFEDIASRHVGSAPADHPFTSRMIITNTKFTEQAEAYAACIGLTLVSWDYPEKGNLRELIERTGVHPVSCLTTLSRTHKVRLMEQGIVLCQQLPQHTKELEELGLSQVAIDAVYLETRTLCTEGSRVFA